MAGTDLNSIADPEIATALNTLLTLVNGNIDTNNINATAGITAAQVAAALAQSASVNQAAQTVKGTVNIATSQATGSTTFTTLATPDQVTGIVLPTNGLIRVWYQATWQEAVSGAAAAGIFLGANQAKYGYPGGGAPVINSAVIGGNMPTNTNTVLATTSGGLSSVQGVTLPTTNAYTSNVTTGQILGGPVGPAGSVGTLTSGGPCDIFGLPAGTYTVSVQFKAASGTVTVANRQLWVQALSFG